MKTLRLALSQFNATVGDIKGNARRICGEIQKAKKTGADLVVFPELSITGYPPQDLIERPSFVARAIAAVDRLLAETAELSPAFVCGSIEPSEDGRRVRNLAKGCCEGWLAGALWFPV